MTIRRAAFVSPVMVWCGLLAAQTADNTQLKQVIVFGRHAVRTPNTANSVLNNLSALPYPNFPASGLSVITPNGQTNETILGGYGKNSSLVYVELLPDFGGYHYLSLRTRLCEFYVLPSSLRHTSKIFLHAFKHCTGQ